jgi:DNA-binding MarR family transcriptional regulator
MIIKCNNKAMRKPHTESQSCSRPAGRSAAAFLLAQVGAHAASKFGERLAKLKLAPPHAGMLRILSSTPGITQQRLAAILGMVPSRLVALVDDMESRGLIERQENRDDRRRHALHITDKGRSMLDKIGELSREHAEALLTALSDDERALLATLLQRIADEQGLTRGVHPGFSGL